MSSALLTRDEHRAAQGAVPGTEAEENTEPAILVTGLVKRFSRRRHRAKGS